MTSHKNLVEHVQINLREDLEIFPAADGGMQIKDPVSKQFFYIGQKETLIIRLLAKHSPSQIIKDAGYSEEEMVNLLTLLKGYRLLAGSEPNPTLKRLNRGLAEYFTFRKSIYNPDSILEKLSFLSGALFSRLSIILQVVFFAFALAIGVDMHQEFTSYGWPLLFNSWFLTLLFFVICLFTVLTLHELAHSVVLKKYGGHVPEIGFCWIYLLPSFYSDLTDIHKLENKYQKTLVMLAGPLLQLLIGSFTFILWSRSISHSFISDLLYIFTFASFSSLLINMNPFLKLDGYYILEFWTGIDNLRAKAWSFVFSPFMSKKTHTEEESSNTDKLIYLIYAPVSIIYSFVIFSWIFGFYFSYLILPSPVIFFTAFMLLLIFHLSGQLIQDKKK